MAKVSYAGLKLKAKHDVKTFDFCGNEIEVLQYLGAEDKYDLLMITLQKAEEDGIYNAFKLDVFFHLNLVYMYTNLSFTDKQKEDELRLYDALKSNGFIDKMLEAMDEDEYDNLLKCLEDILSDIMTYRNTAGAVLQSVIQDLPKNAAAAKEIVDSFDKEKYQEVIQFAQAANGGRDLKTNGKLVQMTGQE